MKSYKRTLVMMAGLPGAGKSTLASSLEKELGWLLINKDKYRIEFLEQGVDFDDASSMAYTRSFDEIRANLLQEQISIIFDTAAIHRFVIETVKELLTECAKEVQLKVILCVVERDKRRERLENRIFQHTRNTVDPATLIDYESYFAHLPDDKLILYTDGAKDECIIEIKKYLMS